MLASYHELLLCSASCKCSLPHDLRATLMAPKQHEVSEPEKACSRAIAAAQHIQLQSIASTCRQGMWARAAASTSSSTWW